MNKDENTMQVTISYQGDISVGIRPWWYEMTIYRFSNDDNSKEYRERIREQIKTLYMLTDGEFECQVYFDDEKID